MNLPDFKLERYFARYEFSAPYLLCCSDCESITIKDLLAFEGESSLDALQNLWLGYTEAQGNPELRQNIAGLYRGIKPDEILVTSGAEEAIFIFMNIALERGDHVIVQYPCYQSLFEIANSIGCNVTKWMMEEKDSWEIDLNFLAGSINNKTKAIILNSPHNPTGCQISQEDMKTIVDLAAAQGVLLFSDEVYRGLEYERTSPAAAAELYESAVSLGVMSKTYGLPGLRIGWAATGNKDLYRKMASFKDYTSICNSAPSEFLAALALRHGDKLVDRNLGIIESNLLLLDSFFSRYAEFFSWPRPNAGPIAFPGIKWPMDVEQFCIDLVQSSGVLLLPGNYYDYDNKHFRIGFGRQNMPQCLEQLEQYVNKKLLSTPCHCP